MQNEVTLGEEFEPLLKVARQTGALEMQVKILKVLQNLVTEQFESKTRLLLLSAAQTISELEP